MALLNLLFITSGQYRVIISTRVGERTQ